MNHTALNLSLRIYGLCPGIEVPSTGTSLGPDGRPTTTAGTGAQVIQRPVLWPHDMMDMDEGYTVLYSHRAKGPVFAFAPWPPSLE